MEMSLNILEVIGEWEAFLRHTRTSIGSDVSSVPHYIDSIASQSSRNHGYQSLPVVSHEEDDHDRVHCLNFYMKFVFIYHSFPKRVFRGHPISDKATVGTNRETQIKRSHGSRDAVIVETDEGGRKKKEEGNVHTDYGNCSLNFLAWFWQ